MPDPVMTDTKDKETLLDDLRASVGQAAWFPEGPMSGDMAMEPLNHDNMKFDDMPPLETFSSSPAPYTSPVHSAFLETDGIRSNIIDGSAQYGVVGLRNLGNTCFLNAGLQCLTSNSRLIQFFLETFDLDETMVQDTLTGAMADVMRRVWSAQYLVLQPTNFKNVLATYHPQFKDFRQHDCQEFLALLLDTLHEQLNVGRQWHSNKLHSSPPRDPVSQSEEVTVSQSEDVIVNQSDDVSIKSESSQSDPAQNSAPSSPLDSAPGPASRLLPDTQSSCVSEDSNQSEASLASNQSESSLASDVTITAEDASRRLAAIPESLKRRYSSEDHVMQEEGRGEGGSPEVAGEDSAMSGKRLPSIEDFYMKGTKTLNTNVLASEYMDESVTTDSDKFHKPDNVTRTTDPYENLSDFLMSEVKGAGAKPLKETNLLANVRDKLSEGFYSKKCLFTQLEAAGDKVQEAPCNINNTRGKQPHDEAACSINNIKRIKIDEDEKNIRMQAKLKVNTNKNPTREAELRSPVRGAERGRGAGEGAASSPRQDLWEASVLQADQAWAKYKDCNQSVIVDTFQGQFKSTVVCSECRHVSVTYEPFMYLSVPLPHAMERQMSVVFVPCDTRHPIRYLLTLHKHDNIKKVKQKLRQLIEEESCDIIVAEVFDNHIARILEDNTLLKYVNETNRTIYAFEMLPPPQIEEVVFGNDDASTLTGSLTSGSDDTLTGPNNLVSSVANNAPQTPSYSSNNAPQTSSGYSSDVFSNMGSFSMEDVSGAEGGKTTVINNQNNTRIMNSTDNNTRMVSSTDKGGFEGHSILNNLGGEQGTWSDTSTTADNLEWQDNLVRTNQGGVIADKDCNNAVPEGEEGSDACLWKQSSTESDVTSGEATWGTPVDVGPVREEAEVTTDQWKSCAICLDEMADRELMVHTACGGTLCQACLEMSYEHYGEGAFMCPVCSSPVSPTSDFLQLNAMADYKPKTRILPVPIVQRYDAPGTEGQVKGLLFGHPSIIYLPSHMTGEFLYETVDRVVSCLVSYTIHLTDGQGYHCSRCMYTEHCSGCEVQRDTEVTLQPGDHLAVHFSELGEEQLDGAQRVADHTSMRDKRPDQPLTLTDCFNAFMDSEVLDEHNPWFCPCCKKNQCANKTMTVWRYPQTLVVYLKRFVFHELTSTKIDSKVVFPLDNMDLTQFNSGPKTCDLTFDLRSCVCHFGGVNAGHYTSYAKNPNTCEWFYYNDETATPGAPTDEDFKNTYILFYQQQGTDVKLNLSPKKFPDEDVAMAISAPIPLPAYQPSTLNNDAICQFLQELDSDRPSQEDAQGALDFYS